MRAAAESDAVWIIFIICVRSVPYKYVERHHPRLYGTRARPRTGAQREDSAGVRALAGGDSRHGSRVCVEGVTATSRAGSDGSQPVLALLLLASRGPRDSLPLHRHAGQVRADKRCEQREAAPSRWRV